jgi:hypothetical protein
MCMEKKESSIRVVVKRKKRKKGMRVEKRRV